MSEQDTILDQEFKPPDVDAAKMIDRKRLEAELLSVEGQLRRFGRIRDRLVAAGRDPILSYQALQERRGEVAVALKRSRAELQPSPDVADPQPSFHPPKESLLSRPIAAARFDGARGIFDMGTAGLVQLAPAAENLDIVPHGQYPSSGEIRTVPGSYPGGVGFAGEPMVGPDAIPVNQYDPSINYFWLHSWKYLIPFPPPTGLSRFTYRFNVNASLSLFGGAEGFVWCFVSLGETPTLTQGTDVTVNIDGGWPLQIDLEDVTYGQYYGSGSTVQRSFLVGAGNVPGVAVVVGVICGLAMQSETNLWFPTGFSGIEIATENGIGGQVAYTYQPQLVIHP
jgi:hypothetical protein